MSVRHAPSMATLAVIAGVAANSLPVLFVEDWLANPPRLLGFMLWQSSPWLLMALSLRFVRGSSKLEAVHALVSLALLVVSLMILFSMIGGTKEALSLVSLLFLGLPIAGIPLATIGLVASWLGWRDDRAADRFARAEDVVPPSTSAESPEPPSK